MVPSQSSVLVIIRTSSKIYEMAINDFGNIQKITINENKR